MMSTSRMPAGIETYNATNLEGPLEAVDCVVFPNVKYNIGDTAAINVKKVYVTQVHC